MDPAYSKRINDVIRFSREEALRLGHDYIGVEHLMLGILRDGENNAIKMLKNLQVDLVKLKNSIEKAVRPEQKKVVITISNIPLLRQTDKILKHTILEAKKFRCSKADAEHILLAILNDEDNLVTKTLLDFDVNYSELKAEMELMASFPHGEFSSQTPPSDDPDDDDDEGFSHQAQRKQSDVKSRTPVLDNFGRDLTKLADAGKLDPVIGREKEIQRVSQILSRRKKNNPILIGEPGVGKSAIAEGLAIRIIQRKVPRVLFNKRIVTLDLGSIVAGTKYRGQFEERMKAVMNELEKSPDVILFIDEIHTLIGAGGASGSLDASNMFKPALARGELQCIGATTLDEYRQYIEKDGALDRRFQRVMIDPTTEDETLEILKNIKDRYENHHNVIYTDEALKECVYLTSRYITDRYLPDKAIDALDESGSRVHIININVPKNILDLEKKIEEVRDEKTRVVKNQKYEEAAKLRDKERQLMEQLDLANKQWDDAVKSHREIVTGQSVAEVVSMMTGIPVQRVAQNESERLLHMYDEVRNHIIGQDEAVMKVVKAIQRNRAGLKDPNRPIGSFILLGPTGVGKTQLAKVLAEYLFDSVESLVRIDMSEYMEKFAVSRLIGAPPGYVGYEEGGQLTEKVRRKPYSVVLFDEIEKAHPDVFNILLQILDEGTITDSLGRKVDFKNTIILMTSNIGTKQLKDFGKGVGFETKARKEQSVDYERSVIENALKKTFAPEFLNRIDEIIIFNSLTRDHIHSIIDIELKELFRRIEKMGYAPKITDEAKDFIADVGFDEKFGARPLKRAIQRYLEDPLAEEIIKSVLAQGDILELDYDKEKKSIKINVAKPGEKSSAKSKEKIDKNN